MNEETIIKVNELIKEAEAVARQEVSFELLTPLNIAKFMCQYLALKLVEANSHLKE